MPHLAQLIPRRQADRQTDTCMRQSWFVPQQRSVLQGMAEELEVWEGRTSICRHSPAESKVMFGNRQCLIEDTVSWEEEENSPSLQCLKVSAWVVKLSVDCSPVTR